MLFFTSIGKVYKLKVHELPPGSRTTKGKAIVNILPIEENETVKAILPIEKFEEGRYILTATRAGVVKKTDVMAYAKVLSVGIIALSLKEDDELVEVRTTSGDDYVFLTSSNGQAILFFEQDARSMGRTAAGVFGMRFRDGDTLVSMTVIPAELMERVKAGEEVGERLLMVTERGYGKRTELSEYSVQNRGGLGVITIKTSDRNGPVVGARLVHNEDELMLITNHGQIIRTRVEGISVIGRNTQGVRLMTMDEDELVVGLARLIPEDEDEALLGEELG